MLKRSITYTDFEGNTVTDIYYFNLTRVELVDLEVAIDGGLTGTIQRIVDTQDGPAIIKEFQRIILLAYGEKSEDGKRFIKSDELRQRFSQTAAYDALFMEMLEDPGKASEFIKGIMPVEVQNVTDLPVQNVPIPPPPPTAA